MNPVRRWWSWGTAFDHGLLAGLVIGVLVGLMLGVLLSLAALR